MSAPAGTVHLRLTRRERRAALARRALTLAVRRVERGHGQRAASGSGGAADVASFDRARARGGRPVGQ